MAFNQQQRTGTVGRTAENLATREEAMHGTNAAGQPNSVLGKAAERFEGRGSGTGAGYGTGAGNLETGVGTRDSQYGTDRAGFQDEQLAGQRMQHGVTGVQGIRSETTGQSDSFCPNPNTPGLVSCCVLM
jgi:hypothetical protein